MRKHIGVGSLVIVMALWGLNLGYPMVNLQHVQMSLFGHAIPIYYFLTVVPMLGVAASVLAFKRDWTEWEMLWCLLPMICLPGILTSADRIWSVRQWLSWIVRGIIPGGAIFLTACRRKSKALLLFWIYPIIIAASLLGLTELYFDYNPLYNGSFAANSQSPESSNPFYRTPDVIVPSPRPYGTQGNRIPYAATIVAYLPLGFWLLKYRKNFFGTNSLAIGAMISILFLSSARSSWIAMLAAVLLMRVVGLHKNRGSAKILVGVLVCLAVFLAWPKTRDILWPRLNSFHLAQRSIELRLEVFQTTKVFKDRGLLGVGFGQFPTACRPYYHSKLPWIGTPDNQYLRWAMENGVPSLILLLTFFAGLVHAGWKKIQSIENVQDVDFYKSLLVGWLSIAVTFFFFDGFYWGACNMTFWCLLGLFASCLTIDGRPPDVPRP